MKMKKFAKFAKNTYNIGVQTDIDSLSIPTKTTVEKENTENAEMNLSTNENGSIESFIVNSADKTIKSNIVEDAEDASNNVKEDVTTNDEEEETSISFAVNYSISSFAINDVAISNVVVEIDVDAQNKSKGKNVFSDDNDSLFNNFFSDDKFFTSSSSVLENAVFFNHC